MEDFKISTEYDGATRKLFRCECKQCQAEFWRPKHILHKATCCSNECYKLFREKIGKRVDVVCTQCGGQFKRFQHHLAKVESKRYFCSRKCRQEATIRFRTNCLNCSIEVIGKNRKYCSRECDGAAQYNLNIDKWKRGELTGLNISDGMSSWLRKYILEKFNNKCSKCNWSEIHPITKNVPVQIDHIDGDYTNNKEENLRLLCPNCHSLTPTYGVLNLGRGRKKRREQRQISA